MSNRYGPNGTENSMTKMFRGILLFGTDLWSVRSSAMQQCMQTGHGGNRNSFSTLV